MHTFPIIDNIAEARRKKGEKGRKRKKREGKNKKDFCTIYIIFNWLLQSDSLCRRLCELAPIRLGLLFCAQQADLSG